MLIDHYVLFYETVEDYLEKRQVYRADHLDLIKLSLKNKTLIMGGAFDDPADSAMLIFTDRESAETFAQNDPYVLNGVIRKWSIRVWKAVDEKSIQN